MKDRRAVAVLAEAEQGDRARAGRRTRRSRPSRACRGRRPRPRSSGSRRADREVGGPVVAHLDHAVLEVQGLDLAERAARADAPGWPAGRRWCAVRTRRSSGCPGRSAGTRRGSCRRRAARAARRRGRGGSRRACPGRSPRPAGPARPTPWRPRRSPRPATLSSSVKISPGEVHALAGSRPRSPSPPAAAGRRTRAPRRASRTSPAAASGRSTRRACRDTGVPSGRAGRAAARRGRARPGSTARSAARPTPAAASR